MDIELTNEEFHETFSSLSFHHAPEGYWDKVHEERKKHRYVGRKAIYKEDGCPTKVVECVEAEDDLVIFQFSNSTTQLIVSGDKVADIKWLKM